MFGGLWDVTTRSVINSVTHAHRGEPCLKGAGEHAHGEQRGNKLLFAFFVYFSYLQSDEAPISRKVWQGRGRGSLGRALSALLGVEVASVSYTRRFTCYDAPHYEPTMRPHERPRLAILMSADKEC